METKSPTTQKYDNKGNENLPNVDPGVIKPVIPNGAPVEVPGVHNETSPLPEDRNSETPSPAPGQA